MPSTYTTNLGIEKIATGEQSGTWGNTTNTNLDILDQSIDGIISITLASAGSSGSPNSLPITDGAVSNGRNKFIEFVDGGDLGATAYVQLTPNDSEKIVHIRNSLSASRSIIVFQGTYNASNDYEILNGEDVLLKFDGAGAGAVVSQVFANLSLPSVNIDGGTIDGATIGGSTAGAGTFTSLDTSAVSGIVESNANFIDTCLVGPSIDGKAWAGKFENGSVWSSLMLATVETSGANAEVNIWDLTAGVLASASPLATVTLTGATPTSIAASMGYVIVGTSDQGMHIVDPHDGAWAERTDGWPRSLTASTTPSLVTNNLNDVTAGVVAASPRDPRTGGMIPSFGIAYAATETCAIIRADGNVYDKSGVFADTIAFSKDRFHFNRSDDYVLSSQNVNTITADDWQSEIVQGTTAGAQGYGLGADTSLDGSGDRLAASDAGGLTLTILNEVSEAGSTTLRPLNALITNAYNTGYTAIATKLAALANSKTADRSGNGGTLTENNTVTEAAVETGAELKKYNSASGTGYLSDASPAAGLSLANSDFTHIFWIYKTDDVTTTPTIWYHGPAGGVSGGNGLRVELQNDGTVRLNDGSQFPACTQAIPDAQWTQIAFARNHGNDTQDWYVNGVHINQTNAGVYTSDSSPVLNIFARDNGSAIMEADVFLSLYRVAAVEMSADQIRKAYEAEKGMFAANAKCLLQGASNAVLDARVDPLTGKYIVTQSDTQDIFDGLTIDTERTIATGGTTFEHGLLWGDGVAEINDANLYASMPATDQRQVNEMVRSMAAELPAGVDLGKAKAWVVVDNSGTPAIVASYNIESISDTATGVTGVVFGTPFKDDNWVGLPGVQDATDGTIGVYDKTPSECKVNVKVAGSNADRNFAVAFFGELENE